MEAQMIAIGIDPGIANTGYAIVSRHNATGNLSVTTSGIVKTSSRVSEAKRALEVYSRLSEAVSEADPDVLAVEKVYFNRNVSSAISTGGVIYICLLIAEQAGIPSIQVSPQQAKAAIGNSKASKDEVKRVIRCLTGEKISNAHTSDAVAIAIAGLLKGQHHGNR